MKMHKTHVSPVIAEIVHNTIMIYCTTSNYKSLFSMVLKLQNLINDLSLYKYMYWG